MEQCFIEGTGLVDVDLYGGSFFITNFIEIYSQKRQLLLASTPTSIDHLFTAAFGDGTGKCGRAHFKSSAAAKFGLNSSSAAL
jgi:hypothetical protein